VIKEFILRERERERERERKRKTDLYVVGNFMYVLKLSSN